jgi:hypothetical protein
MRQLHDSPPQCLRCHKIMVLTSTGPHALPNVDIEQYDCKCGYLVALPVLRKNSQSLDANS